MIKVQEEKMSIQKFSMTKMLKDVTCTEMEVFNSLCARMARKETNLSVKTKQKTNKIDDVLTTHYHLWFSNTVFNKKNVSNTIT